MRDRLGHLQAVLNEHHATGTPDWKDPSPADPELRSEPGASAGPLNPDPPAARDQDLEGVLREAEQIRLDIQQIQRDVSDLREAHAQASDNHNNTESVKNRSSAAAAAIGADIKRRGEAVLQRLHGMKALGDRLEAQHGPHAVVVRIARTQSHCLGNALREVMFSYNAAEMSHRESCRRRIQRQLEIVGGDVPYDHEELLEEMLEAGEGAKVFGVGLEGKTAHSALVEMEGRHSELQQLEQRIRGIQEVFLDVAVLTEEQGVVVESIQKNVSGTEAAVQETIDHLKKANKHDNNNVFKRLFCACFPCYKS